MSKICRFCDISCGNIGKRENQIIWETDKYYALPSIGALVEGWLLIIPREHTISMKDLYGDNEFKEFTNIVLGKMRSQYPGAFIAFEHGPNECGSNTSCGTDHAHLHIVSYQNSLYKDMVIAGQKWEGCESEKISLKAGENEYLFYTEIPTGSTWLNQSGYMSVLEQPCSQYFRKLIANQLNCPTEYDYRAYPRVDTAIRTSRVLSSAILHA
jgi:diadenosine tetraphosphate (Ap4A) HIT family hydrolase